MATDFAPGGAKNIPCAKEAPHYTVAPWSSKVVHRFALNVARPGQNSGFFGTEVAALYPLAKSKKQCGLTGKNSFTKS